MTTITFGSMDVPMQAKSATVSQIVNDVLVAHETKDAFNRYSLYDKLNADFVFGERSTFTASDDQCETLTFDSFMDAINRIIPVWYATTKYVGSGTMGKIPKSDLFPDVYVVHDDDELAFLNGLSEIGRVGRKITEWQPELKASPFLFSPRT